MSISGSSSVWLIVGGMNPLSSASAHPAAASALAAPMACPSMDFRELTGGVFPAKTWRIAATSVTSLALVPVPWAEM